MKTSRKRRRGGRCVKLGLMKRSFLSRLRQRDQTPSRRPGQRKRDIQAAIPANQAAGPQFPSSFSPSNSAPFRLSVLDRSSSRESGVVFGSARLPNAQRRPDVRRSPTSCPKRAWPSVCRQDCAGNPRPFGPERRGALPQSLSLSTAATEARQTAGVLLKVNQPRRSLQLTFWETVAEGKAEALEDGRGVPFRTAGRTISAAAAEGARHDGLKDKTTDAFITGGR
ncbi:hypothetical protein SKAU_G00298310 [Synaphobranchus kaupii]|uniref:Uncharacterized protein n=1 Tax=Synaphobranchus kaupii TaxID=118154 RepID=A0A9Q1EV89_SYNKA|nr:hypothetical protein SKAU_G00298310 [Synaphobranchus kaupii]